MENIDELVARLAQGASPVKPASHPFMLSLKWIAVAVIYLGVSLAISGLRPDLMTALHDGWFLAELLSLLSIFIVTALSAALLAFPDLHQKRLLVFAPVLPVFVFLMLMYFSWLNDKPPAAMPMHSFECTLSILLVALLPAVGAFYAMRQYASIHHRQAGSVALLCAFSVGALWLRLHEQTNSIVHVIEWHYLPMLLVAFVGMWLGKRLLKW